MLKLRYRSAGLLVLCLVMFKARAQYSFNPQFEKMQQRVSFVPGIKVIRGETVEIVPMQKSGCPSGVVFRFNNGVLQAGAMRSADSGKTWHKTDHEIGPSAYQFPQPDNETIHHSFRTRKGSKPGVYEATFYRSKDQGITWSVFTAVINIPAEMNWSGVTDRKITGLKDGSLLMTLYGKIANTIGSSVLLVRSTDHGKTWSYYATVAFNLTDKLLGEGFCEPVLLVVPGNKICCFIRSSGNYPASLGSSDHNNPSVKMPFPYHKTTPLFMSVSGDMGKTWSNATSVNDFGVWPDALVLENGIIALSYGRPGNWLTFSNDNGASWGPRLQFYNDLYPPDCGNYMSMTEVAPNVLFVVYGRTDPNDHTRSEIVGTYFQIKKYEQ
ncbi:glycoside hydrolase [Niabella pedocola]|uniref:Glycoside hydrolase n=1 Tax=Niabella pedocola TaxID=1752077 RepID=A0ABS8PNL9_9BACT|nr:sialidase family protein [Niabella pedocola]MCD2422694.1 glycoside hydrolase [Niabella pedocola]